MKMKLLRISIKIIQADSPFEGGSTVRGWDCLRVEGGCLV